MNLVVAVVPFLAVLACPLMMLLCVVGIRRTGHGACQAGTAPPGPREERVAALQRQLQAVHAELAALEAPASPQAPDGGQEPNGHPAGAIPEGARATRRPA